MKQLKQNEHKLEKFLRKQEEETQRRIWTEQKVQEDAQILEKERLRNEVRSYKKHLFDEKIKHEEEMRRNQEQLENRLRCEIETKLRKEFEDLMQKQLDERMHKEIERERHQEIQHQHKEMLEKKRLLNIKREEQRNKEIKLLEQIEYLKNLDRDIDAKKGEALKVDAENENDRYMKERLDSLKREMENLEERIQMKSRDGNTQSTTKPSKSTSEKSFGKPKLPQFDGTQFEGWKLEVTSRIESGLYQDDVLSQAVRNSIVSNARRVLQTLKPSATTKDIMKKMEDIYGNIRSGDSIIHEFYSARQSGREGCSELGVRIETVFNQALERGEIEEFRKDKKLKERFWRGLRSEKIKLTTRALYESSDSFDILRRKARIEEMEMKLEGSSVKPEKEVPVCIKETKANIEEVKVCTEGGRDKTKDGSTFKENGRAGKGNKRC